MVDHMLQCRNYWEVVNEYIIVLGVLRKKIGRFDNNNICSQIT